VFAEALLLVPLLASQAFELPSSTKTCVSQRTLEVTVNATAPWTRATVKVNGKRVKQVHGARSFKVRNLPRRPFTFVITARTDDGRSATARRHYKPCPPGPKPQITIPAGPPPTVLVKRDLITGTGARPRRGHTVTVQYVGVAWSTRQEFDSSWSRHEPFAFTFKTGQVIKGFDQGIAGMRVGGRREVTMPPDEGYGDDGVGDAIAPDETLVFVIDLIAVD